MLRDGLERGNGEEVMTGGGEAQTSRAHTSHKAGVKGSGSGGGPLGHESPPLVGSGSSSLLSEWPRWMI